MKTSPAFERGLPVVLCLLAWPLAMRGTVPAVSAATLPPASVEGSRSVGSGEMGRFSERTLGVALEVNNAGARLLSFTLKNRPFVRPLLVPAIRSYAEGGTTQIEVVLHGPAETQYLQRIDIGVVCLSHGPETPAHVEGDTIRVHRDSIVVEVPEVPGFDRVEVAYYVGEKGAVSRRSLGIEPLATQRFDPAGSAYKPSDLALGGASGPDPQGPLATIGAVHWPEEFGDPDVYTLYGDVNEVDRRINLVIVPDGYTYSEKALMKSHAQALVDAFRGKTPYREHDPFLNYTLVYAYSTETGTDQCDCSIVKDTAMGTRFPQAGYPCGDSGNRCLYYGSGCDTSSLANIAAAELRAPASDKTVIMVNTVRYGGCGGSRAVYAAGNGAAAEIAIHEVAHSLGGLADEYGGSGCGSYASEINTSVNGATGAWPEWLADLGSPQQGAQYYDACLYRPEFSCDMRSLGPPFCRVCNQHWGLVYFGHSRTAPTAPMQSASPASWLAVDLGTPVDFSISTRLASGPNVTNSITWQLQGPSDPAPVTLATDTTSVHYVFWTSGTYLLTSDLVADTNFIKPEKYGSNRDVATWDIQASAWPTPGEVSPPGSAQPLSPTGRDALAWEDASASGSSSFNLYRGTVSGLAAGDYGSCLMMGVRSNGASDSELPPPGVAWSYLVSGRTSGGEGPIGTDSAGNPRINRTPCVAFLPDLVIDGMSHTPSSPTSVDVITFTTVVKNVGDGTAGASTLSFRIGGEAPGSPGTLFSVPTLAPGASSSFQRQATLPAGGYQNRSNADYYGVVAESNETNNQGTEVYTVTAAAP